MRPDPSVFSRPAIEEDEHGMVIVNWTTRDLALPFSEGGPTMAERERILRRLGKDIGRAQLKASVALISLPQLTGAE